MLSMNPRQQSVQHMQHNSRAGIKETLDTSYRAEKKRHIRCPWEAPPLRIALSMKRKNSRVATRRDPKVIEPNE